MWSNQWLSWLRIIPIVDLFSSTICGITSLLLSFIELTLSILYYIYLSKHFNLLISSLFMVHASDAHNTTLRIIDLILLLFRFLFSFPFIGIHVFLLYNEILVFFLLLFAKSQFLRNP